jgi:hypothetical protein
LRRNRPRKAHTKKPWAERVVERGAGLAFAAGVALDLFPGFFPFVAMKDIAQLHYGDAAKFALVVAFYVIMFAFVEAPIVGDLVAHERTTELAHRFNAWLSRNARRLVIGVLATAGTYLVLRAIVRLVS